MGRSRATVWKHFKEVDRKFLCKYCGHCYTVRNATKMKKHLRTCKRYTEQKSTTFAGGTTSNPSVCATSARILFSQSHLPSTSRTPDQSSETTEAGTYAEHTDADVEVVSTRKRQRESLSSNASLTSLNQFVDHMNKNEQVKDYWSKRSAKFY